MLFHKFYSRLAFGMMRTYSIILTTLHTQKGLPIYNMLLYGNVKTLHIAITHTRLYACTQNSYSQTFGSIT